MYEFSLTNSVNDAVQELCRQTGSAKVRRVFLKVGRMRKVNPELVAFIFAALSKDTPAEEALLSVMLLPVTVRCCSCGNVSTRDDSEALCSSCGSSNVRVLSGLELAVEVEVEGSMNHES